MPKRHVAALAAGTTDRAFYETKLVTARYYMARQLPATALHLARIQSGADTGDGPFRRGVLRSRAGSILPILPRRRNLRSDPMPKRLRLTRSFHRGHDQ